MNQTQAIIVGAAVTFLILAIIGYLTEKKGGRCGACTGACNCGRCPGCVSKVLLTRERFALGNTDVPHGKGKQIEDNDYHTMDSAYINAFSITNRRF